jgi:hypothetical protein
LPFHQVPTYKTGQEQSKEVNINELAGNSVIEEAAKKILAVCSELDYYQFKGAVDAALMLKQASNKDYTSATDMQTFSEQQLSERRICINQLLIGLPTSAAKGILNRLLEQIDFNSVVLPVISLASGKQS